MERSKPLQDFIDAALDALNSHVRSQTARQSIAKISTLLYTAGTQKAAEGFLLPVCSYLERAVAIPTTDVKLANLLANFRTIEPSLVWKKRPDPNGTASANFEDGHANTMILGPGGLEERSDVLIGVSLLAPQVRYPDHSHAPEETYLVLSDGEFRQGEGEWFSPGFGGTFYNPPGINHAMRSVDSPLFVLWALLVNQKL